MFGGPSCTIDDPVSARESYRHALDAALSRYAPGCAVAAIDDCSNQVSTNVVYRVRFEDGEECFAKVSSYGSYVHFRQDHRLIERWSALLDGGRFSGFLAPVLTHAGAAFTHRHGEVWVALYGKAPFYDFLPPVLTDDQVDALGRELASLHLESLRVQPRMELSWKSVGSDIAILYDALRRSDFVEQCALSPDACSLIETHCDRFLEQAEAIGYGALPRIPVLVDWNITNFSVGLQEQGFRLFTRWDYDWFRLDSRVFDFYFAARVVRAEGDQDHFTYDAGPLLEPRFARFLRAYHTVAPLTEAELRFVPEAYRFFLLNYVIRVGEHFFRPEFCERLRREVVEQHLPALDRLDFGVLLDVLRD